MNRHLKNPSTTPLETTQLDVRIADLCAQYTVRHGFRNAGDDAIEAVFSFPIPLDAAFIGMTATLGGETLCAQIQPRRQAERTYGDAIAEGDSAVLLTHPEPGLLNLSLGNLAAGESGEVELRFVAPLRVADRCARFSLPLVHRPRYGAWRLDALETPTHDFVVEHPMSATIRVEGLLAQASVTCTNHAARFTSRDGVLEMAIGHAMLDRDLVVSFDLERPLAPAGRLIADGDATLGLASFVLPMKDEAPRPLDLCLVLDGSGSMDGDAIEQSRAATLAVIAALREDDRIQVLRFGSTTVPLFRRPLLATGRVRASLRELVPTIRSDLGGTEMGAALTLALDQLGPVDAARSRSIILVTDGAVQPRDIAAAQAASIEAGVRIFVVAVGSSAGSEVLEPMAEATGATLERAVPAEPIDAGVMRQFRRSRAGSAVVLQATWPQANSVPIPMGIAYPGDAVSVAARWAASAIGGEVTVQAPALRFELRVALGERVEAPASRALLGQQRHRHAQVDREAIALSYGLLTRETSAVLVKARVEKIDGMPVIVPIAQMVPQGMIVRTEAVRGVASTRSMYTTGSGPACAALPSPMPQQAGGGAPVERARVGRSFFGLPAFLRKSDGEDARPVEIAITAARVREVLDGLHRVLRDALLASPPCPITLDQALLALPASMREHARHLLEETGVPTDEVPAAVGVFIALHTALGEPAFDDDSEAGLAVLESGRPSAGGVRRDAKSLSSGFEARLRNGSRRQPSASRSIA